MLKCVYLFNILYKKSTKLAFCVINTLQILNTFNKLKKTYIYCMVLVNNIHYSCRSATILRWLKCVKLFF